MDEIYDCPVYDGKCLYGEKRYYDCQTCPKHLIYEKLKIILGEQTSTGKN